jgi:TonB family protein
VRRLKVDSEMTGNLSSCSLGPGAVSRAAESVKPPPRGGWLVAVCAALAAPAWPAPPQTPVPAAAVTDQAAIDAALQLYGARLLHTALQHRGYPEAALQQKVSGVAVVEITVGADGKLKNQTLVGSTRHGVLDEHALQLMQLAVPLTEVPSALSGRAFRVPVSINYVIPD